MDEYFCDAYPDPYAIDDLVSEKPCSPKDQYFNVEIKRTDMHVLSARKFETFEQSTHHSFANISKDDMMQETTIIGWLSSIGGVPQDAHKIVVAKILDCAHSMANWTHKDKRVLYMRVDVTITIAREDEDEGEGEDEGEDEDDGCSLHETEESESDDDEGEEEFMEEDEGEDPRLEPASKSCIEGLEIVKVEEGCVHHGKCAICLEDLDVVGVRMPCLHKFHRNCIVDWLSIGSSCPLCRFQMPTNEDDE